MRETILSTIIAYIKTGGYALSVFFFSYLNIPHEQVILLSILIMIDFIVGVGKQFRIDPRGITSHRAWLGVMKKASTFIVLAVLAIMWKGVGGDSADSREYLKTIISILIMAETYSIIQNVYAIRTGKLLPEYDVISILLKKIGSMIESRIEILDDKNRK
ncbi:MAG TPA: phage holin family protein [Candidatus Absconditabacterales bacterium]|nr:phage holin family protein [Candidatus Absconditabacterales bacterium]